MTDYNFHRERVGEIVRRRPVYAELLDFLVIVIETRRKAALELSPLHPAPVDEKFRKKLEGGLPVLDRADLPLDDAELRRFFEPMLDLLEERKPDEVAKIRSALADGLIDPISWVKASLLNTPVEAPDNKKNIVDEELLTFLAHHATRAIMDLYAQQYAEALASIPWDLGYCPICGGFPHMADLRGPEGRRFLACGTCSFCWSFPRLTCPFCENTDQERLGYLWAESEKEYRVDYCTACKKYIKTVDLREQASPPDLEIEAAATIHLDILAQKEGYEPPMPQRI